LSVSVSVDVENDHETSAALLFDGVRTHSLLAALAVLFALLHLCDGDASGRPLGFELYLVADLHQLEHLGIFHSEHHRHAVFIHVEVLDGTVFERDLSGRFVDFSKLATGVAAMLATPPALAEDANESFIGIAAKIHQMMTDTLLVTAYCPEITGDRQAMHKEILKIAGSGAGDILEAFGETVQGREYLHIQTERFKKGGPTQGLACEMAWLYWGPKGGSAQNVILKR
jgi:hypothetical protein